MTTNNRGLGSDAMSQADKDKIHSMGGKASHTSGASTTTGATAKTGTTGAISNKSGGGRLTKDDQRKGGQH